MHLSLSRAGTHTPRLPWSSLSKPQICEWVYLYIFTFELLCKILAYGFLMHEGSYLRDAWCQLDFVVVTLAWIPILIPSFGNYSVIRSVRALRPLRALKRVPGMPILVSSILGCIPKMGNVSALCGFIFLVRSALSLPERASRGPSANPLR